MSGSDSSPNFDWLTKGAPKKQSALPDPAFPSDSPESSSPTSEPAESTAASQEDDRVEADPAPVDDASSSAVRIGDSSIWSQPPETSETAPAAEAPAAEASATEASATEADSPQAGESHLLEELETVPDPILNESDGTTLIIRNRHPLEGEHLRNFDNPLSMEEFFSADHNVPPQPSEPEIEPTVPQNESTPAESVADAGEVEPDSETEPLTTTAESGDATDTFQVSELIPPADARDAPALHAAADDPGGTEISSAQENFEESAAEALAGNAFTISQPGTSENNLHSEANAPPVNQSDSAEGSGSAVIEETALPAPPEKGDLGRTEVLRSEDIVKANQSWKSFPPLVTESLSTLTGEDHAAVAPSKRNPSEDTETFSGADASASPGPSRMFVILASYASAITIAFLVLLMKQIYENGHPHQLESLPDIATQKENELTYVPPYSGLPRGHTLRLGETQRFGNIEVTPLEIVQAPVEFAHYSGDGKRHRESTQPVWKLRLRLKNVSSDQQIAPLDRRLVLRWVSKRGQSAEYTNYFITEEGTRDRQAPTVQLYRLPVDSDWDMVGQKLGKILQPGESYETYLAAAEEEMSGLPEHLVWRVQIRKGYSSKGLGVTTIFQVAFDKEQVAPEA